MENMPLRWCHIIAAVWQVTTLSGRSNMAPAGHSSCTRCVVALGVALVVVAVAVAVVVVVVAVVCGCNCWIVRQIKPGSRVAIQSGRSLITSWLCGSGRLHLARAQARASHRLQALARAPTRTAVSRVGQKSE